MSSLVLPRVAQLVRMFATPHDGEALGAVRAVGRVLSANGMSFNDLAAKIEHEPAPQVIYRDRPEPPSPVSPAWGNSAPLAVRTKLERAIKVAALNSWERDFATSIVGQIAASRTWRPTIKQEQRLDALIAKLHAAGAWA